MKTTGIELWYDEYIAYCSCPECNKWVEVFLPKPGDQKVCDKCGTKFVIENNYPH